MARGDKSAYTDKQKRKAEHIEDGYQRQGLSKKKAQARAWATVNKQDGGGKLSGSGRAPPSKTSRTAKTAKTAKASKKSSPARAAAPKASTTKTKSAKTSSTAMAAARSRAAKKGWATRRRNAAE